MGNYARQIREASQIPRQASSGLGKSITDALTDQARNGDQSTALFAALTDRTKNASLPVQGLATTDATPTNRSLGLPDDGSACSVVATVIAKQDDLSTAAVFRIEALARRTGGTTTLETTAISAIPAATPYAADIVNVANVLNVQVTGAAATNLNWSIWTMIHEG